MTKNFIYTNESLKADLQEIIRQIMLDDFRPDVIVGVARGGLVPATMLSHYFQKQLMVINYSKRDHMISQMSETKDISDALRSGLNVLIVDDICDSGETLKDILNKIPEYSSLGGEDTIEFKSKLKTAVLWNNISQEMHSPNYVGREISRVEDTRWIIFPYEEWWKS